jgi:hypothetical protein
MISPGALAAAANAETLLFALKYSGPDELTPLEKLCCSIALLIGVRDGKFDKSVLEELKLCPTMH